MVKKERKKEPDTVQENLLEPETNSSINEEPQSTEAQTETDVEFENLIIEIGKLQEELASTQAKANEYLDGWQRSRADFINYKKRIERDQAQSYQTIAGSILKRYLDVLDDLDRALKNRPLDGEGAVWAGGIDLVQRKLITILEGEGVKVMQTQGQVFDPNMHEAISSEDNPEFQSGQIIEVLQNGYVIGDRVLRPALVRVAR